MPAVPDLIAEDLPADPPEGFRLLPTHGGFNLMFGALYGRLRDGVLETGFRVSPRHINPHGTCHGGVLATFADFQIYAAQQAAKTGDRLTPTISMTIDYLSPAHLGEWIEARTELLRATSTIMFSQTLASADGRKVFRSSNTIRLGRSDKDNRSHLTGFFDEDEPQIAETS